MASNGEKRFFCSDDIESFFTNYSESSCGEDEEEGLVDDLYDSVNLIDSRAPDDYLLSSVGCDFCPDDGMDLSASNLDGNSTTEGMFGCKCSEKCYTKFKPDDIIDHKLNMAELSSTELDLVVSAKLQAFMKKDDRTSSVKKKSHERKQVHTYYQHQGHFICLGMFQSIHLIGKDRLAGVRKHVLENGLTIRKKKTAKNYKCHSFTVYKDIVSFLRNLGEECGVKLPGRIPGECNSCQKSQ